MKHKRSNMEERREELNEDVKRLFGICDVEKKGYIVRGDMQRMRSELHFTVDQLEVVFDTLDSSNNGCLTEEQLLSGFGRFLTSKSEMVDNLILETTNPNDYWPTESYETCNYEKLITQLRDTNLLDVDYVITRLCEDVTVRGTQQMQSDLEAFLRLLTQDMLRLKKEQEELEETLQERDNGHEVQVKNLVEEMEAQLKEEREKMTKQVERKIREVRKQLEEEVTQKAEELKEATTENTKMAQRLRLVESVEEKLRREKEEFKLEKEELTSRLNENSRDTQKLRYLLTSQAHAYNQHRQLHEGAGFRLAHRIILETEGLKEQLQTLRAISNTIETSSRQNANNCV